MRTECIRSWVWQALNPQVSLSNHNVLSMTRNCSPSPLTFLGDTMKPVLYSIGFTSATLISLFVGYSPDVPYFQQAALLFGGFCLGGVVICALESIESVN